MEPWNLDKNLIYRLHQVGWRKGEPLMSNEYCIRVTVDPSTDLSEEDANKMAEKIHKLLQLERSIRAEYIGIEESELSTLEKNILRKLDNL